MRSKRIAVAAAAIVIGLALLGGCSKKVAPEDLKKELVNQNMSPERANCIVDGLTAKGVPLENYSSPSADEQTKLTEVATACVAQSVPSTPVS